jgi:hypothetical protein
MVMEREMEISKRMLWGVINPRPSIPRKLRANSISTSLPPLPLLLLLSWMVIVWLTIHLVQSILTLSTPDPQKSTKTSAGPSAHVAQLTESDSTSDEDVFCNNIRLDLASEDGLQHHTYDHICEYSCSELFFACYQQDTHVCSPFSLVVMFSSIHRLRLRPRWELWIVLSPRL